MLSNANTMIHDPLQEKLENGETAYGLMINNPDYVETASHVGFDWFQIDQMFSSNGWAKTEELIRTGEAAGITPVVRIQSNPWLGYDHRLAVDATRNQGVGAKYIKVSTSGLQEIEECIEVTKDWHRKILQVHPFDDFAEWDDTMAEMEKNTYLIPSVESKQGLDEMEEMISREEVNIFFIAMTDASRVVSDSNEPDFYADELWEYVDRAVELGEKTGTAVAANTSYAYTMDGLEERILKLEEHGVNMIMVQHASFLFQISAGNMLDNVKKVVQER